MHVFISEMPGKRTKCAFTRHFGSKKHTKENYGTPEGTFLFQYLPEKKLKQKELEKKSKQ